MTYVFELRVKISWGWEAARHPHVKGISIPEPGRTRGFGWKSSTRVPQLYNPFTGGCKVFCIDAVSSYLNVNTYRSINRA